MNVKEERIDREIHLEVPMDTFFGRERTCKFCKALTQFNFNTGFRYCPKGCFNGNKVNKKVMNNGLGH